MTISFFWYNKREWHAYRWGMRGIAIKENTIINNIHYRDLIFSSGINLRIKLRLGIYAWKRLIVLLVKWAVSKVRWMFSGGLRKENHAS